MRNPAAIRQTPRRRGVAVFFVLICLVTLFSFTALTVDVGYMYNIRAELQNSADAIALASAAALNDGPEAARKRAYELAGMQNGLAKIELRDEDVVFGRWDKDTQVFTPLSGAEEDDANAVRVHTAMTKARDNPVRLFFAPALGRHTTDITASATAAVGSGQPWMIVIVQDVTSSFANELDEARVALKTTLDCMHARATSGTKVAFVTFTGYGQQLVPLNLLDDQYSTLSSAAAAVKQCGSKNMPPCSGTNIGAGLDEAIKLLSGVDEKYRRAIILVSDGEPNSSLKGYTTSDLKKWAIQSAETADQMGISIFTFFFSGNDAAPGASQYLASLAKGQGTAHETPNPSDIETELEQICKEAMGMSSMLVE